MLPDATLHPGRGWNAVRTVVPARRSFMNRPILACAFLVFASAAFAQQPQPNPSDPYQGQSNPPGDDLIVATQPDQPKPKPRAGKPLVQPQQEQQNVTPAAPAAP